MANNISEKTIRIVEELKKRTAKEAYVVKYAVEEEMTLTGTKLGGVPYWDLKQDYPTNKKGEKLVLLAQINFEEEKTKAPLPEKGILQFFIEDDEKDYLMGLNFRNRTMQNGFRVVYHPEIDETVTEDSVRALGIKTCKDCDTSPVFKESVFHLTRKTNYLTLEYFPLTENEIEDILEKLYDEKVRYLYVDEYFTNEEREYMTKELGDNTTSNMLGYPFFTQDDPRDSDSPFDTVLLQLDSVDDDNGNEIIMWGDVGIGNFFINLEDLKRCDFSKVFYTWDCG